MWLLCTRNKHKDYIRDNAFKCPGGSLEVVDSFCYVGGLIIGCGRCSQSMVVRISMGCIRLRELLPLWVTNGFYLGLKGRQVEILYTNYNAMW